MLAVSREQFRKTNLNKPVWCIWSLVTVAAPRAWCPVEDEIVQCAMPAVTDSVLWYRILRLKFECPHDDCGELCTTLSQSLWCAIWLPVANKYS